MLKCKTLKTKNQNGNMAYEKEEKLSDQPNSKLESTASETKIEKILKEIPYSQKVARVRDLSYEKEPIKRISEVIDINT